MSEETNLAKFEVILNEVQKWLARSPSGGASISQARTGIFSASMTMSMLNVLGERINENYRNFTFRYGNDAWKPSFLDNYNSNSYSVMTKKIAGFGIVSSDVIPKTNVVDIIKTYKKEQTVHPDSSFLGLEKPERTWHLSRNCMIFWMLFMAALDDEVYNNELDSIIDLAYCMDFNEAMIRDWCHAVEYVFAGNKLSADCDLECETVEGARFFLHKEK